MRPGLVAARAEVTELVRRLLHRAQESGEVRADVGVEDIPIVLLGVARAAPVDGWRRYLEFALDGLRPV
jgi:hypothetical protein